MPYISTSAAFAAQLAVIKDIDPGLNLESVTHVMSMGATLDPEFPDRLRINLPNEVSNCYGLSEANAITVGNSFSHLGPLVRGVVIKIRDVKSGAILGSNQMGINIVLSKHLFFNSN